jgi:A/G-specific adenine glycosylase
LRSQCYAYAHDVVDELPVRIVKTKRRTVDVTVFVLSCPDGYVLTSPRAKGLLAGLYGLPFVEAALSPEDVPAAVTEWGAFATHVTPLDDAKHVFTHITWRLKGYLVECTLDALPTGCVLATPADIAMRFALPTAFAAYRPYLI